MKNQRLNNGKKLNKKELKTIKGGLLMCIDHETGLCRETGIRCAERQCRYVLEPPFPF
ncbi:bacteriocin-type signal sequence-containing protein [Chryseobacterium ureilyticum]|uniref:Bacteriocin-type signal sequence-containing protein n=1 Tax=Chryseobacterium ureilyticum TaxID=373668 RepID=A0A1N7KV81_9FLAO|nr:MULTISPECIES: bacteriocin [Chryseobacterium]SIS65406.1 bacteriocin-type signal sequence-containing protein [Chryseobacterium ureilyticum]